MVNNIGPFGNVTVVNNRGVLTDYSSSIITANQSQLVIPANPNRKYLLIQNVSSSDLWFNFSEAATIGIPSIRLSQGQGFIMESSFISTEALYVIGATQGQPFTVKEGN